MSEETPVTKALDAQNIPYQFFRHPGDVHSVEQAASERGQKPEQVIRSIVFRLGEGEYVMVLVAGGWHISWPKLRSYLGVNRLTMASEEEVLSATGYRIGTVSPFGLKQPLRILADESVWKPEEISLGTGVYSTGVIMRSTDLHKALGAIETGDFAGE
jgi:Cys-tRNA(Pro) deacylase